MLFANDSDLQQSLKDMFTGNQTRYIDMIMDMIMDLIIDMNFNKSKIKICIKINGTQIFISIRCEYLHAVKRASSNAVHKLIVHLL